MESFIILFMVAIIICGPLLYFVKYYNPKEEQFVEYLDQISKEKHSIGENSTAVKIDLIQKINSRYLEAKKNSRRMLTLTILSLVIGGVSFYFAAYIASNDELRKEEDAKSKIESSLLDKFIFKYATSQGVGDLRSLKERANKEKQRDYNAGQKSPATDSLEKLKNDAHDTYQDSLLIQTVEIYSKQRNTEAANIIDSSYFLFTTISIRIIITFLTFYLAQLFLRLYNYYMEVSDFYINRADAMLAHEEDRFKMNFKELTSIFEHNKKLGIGPKSPLSTAIDIINATKK